MATAKEARRLKWLVGTIALMGLALALVWLPWTTRIGKEANYSDLVDYKVWQLLGQLQFIVWAGLAIVNVRDYLKIRERGLGNHQPWAFLAAVFVLPLLFLVSAQYLGVIAPRGSALAIPAILLNIIAMLAVIPAALSLDGIRAAARNSVLWQESDLDPELMQFLRRRVRPAVASIGAMIGLGIVVTAQIRSVSAASQESTQAPMVLLYGSFFTGVLFSIYLWVNATLDNRSRESVNELAGPSDPRDAEGFIKSQDHRAALDRAFGLGRSPRQSFEGLVAVASPLLAALVASYI